MSSNFGNNSSFYQNIFRGATFPATPTLAGFFRIFFNIRVLLTVVLPSFGLVLMDIPYRMAFFTSGFSWVMRGTASTLMAAFTAVFLATNNYIAYFPHYILAINGMVAQAYVVYVSLQVTVWKTLVLSPSVAYMVIFAKLIASKGYTMMVARLRQDVIIDIRDTGQDVDYRVFGLIGIICRITPQFLFSLLGNMNVVVAIVLGSIMWFTGKLVMILYYYPHEKRNVNEYFNGGQNSIFLITRITSSLTIRVLANLFNYIFIGLGVPYLIVSYAFEIQGATNLFAILGPILSVGFLVLAFVLIYSEFNTGENGYLNTQLGPVFRLLGFNFVLCYIIVVVPGPVDNVTPTIPIHFSFSPNTTISGPLTISLYYGMEFFSLFFMNLTGLSRATGFYTRYVFAFFLYAPGYLLLWAGMHAPMSFDVLLFIFKGFLEGFLIFVTAAQSFQIFSMICPRARGAMIAYEALDTAGVSLPDLSGSALVQAYPYEDIVQERYPGIDFSTISGPVLMSYFSSMGISVWYLYTFITIFASAVILLVLSYIDNDPFLSSPYSLYRVGVLMGLDQQRLFISYRWTHLFGNSGFNSLTSHFSVEYSGSVLFNQIVSTGYGMGLVNLLNNINPSELTGVELEVFNRFHRFRMTYYQAVEDMREVCMKILENSGAEYLLNTYNLITASSIRSEITQFRELKAASLHIPELI